MIGENTVTCGDRERTDALSPPPLGPRRGSAEMVFVRYDALVQLASGLSGGTPDDVAMIVDGLLARGHLDTEPGRSHAPKGTAAFLPGTGLETARLSKGGPVRLGEPDPDDVICEGMVGRSAALRNVVTHIETVAPTDST